MEAPPAGNSACRRCSYNATAIACRNTNIKQAHALCADRYATVLSVHVGTSMARKNKLARQPNGKKRSVGYCHMSESAWGGHQAAGRRLVRSIHVKYQYSIPGIQ